MNLYESLNEEAKNIINKALEIFNILKEKTITYSDGIIRVNLLDKVSFSIFMACFLVDSSIKKELERFKDIKIEDMLEFVDLKFEEIQPLENYNLLYSKSFENFFKYICINKERYYKIFTYTPAVIYSLFNIPTDEIELIFLPSNKKLLDEFSQKYLNLDYIYKHPSFTRIQDMAINNNDMQAKLNDLNSVMAGFFNLDDPGTQRKPSFIEVNRMNLQEGKDGNVEEEQIEDEIEEFDINDDKIWDILEDIKKKFIGQEKACEDIFYNIVNNQRLALRDDVSDGERSIIFIDGPTGTGKTAIIREITDKLNIPFTKTSVTNYSSTGYVGGDITDTLHELFDKAKGNMKLAKRGIIVFDEFDKIAYSREGGLEMKRAVQQQLLDFIGAGTYDVPLGYGLFGKASVDFDTSKITFICLGALTELREEKQNGNQSIGFGNNDAESYNKEYSIKPQDLIDIGLEKELVARFNTFIHTEEYSQEMLLKILKESTISPIYGFRKWIESENKKLVISDDVYSLIAQLAYELNTGARSLQTVMNNIRTPLIKDVLRGKEEIIYLSSEMVAQVNENMFGRRGRN